VSETSLNSLRATLVRTEEKLDDQPSYDNPVAATLIEDIESLVLRIRERERRLPPVKATVNQEVLPFCRKISRSRDWYFI